MAAGKWDFEIEKLRHNSDLYSRIVDAVRSVCSIAVLFLPLLLVRDMVDAVAGETTNINANIVFSAGITLSATGNIAQFFKGSQQRRTIKELRKRTQDLEAQLGLKPADGNR